MSELEHLPRFKRTMDNAFDKLEEQQYINVEVKNQLAELKELIVNLQAVRHLNEHDVKELITKFSAPKQNSTSKANK